ncbi:MAG: hypothetical protein E6H48_21140 [Betaproteobacteria bacterium]|nr:MAG: hypothetical protein E6H48_21140 [Betaproteobacteria bacterium]
MPKPSSSEYAQIIDDIYLAYFKALSTEDDTDLADVFAEYAAPANADAVDRGEDAQQPVTTLPPRKTFRRAA